MSSRRIALALLTVAVAVGIHRASARPVATGVRAQGSTQGAAMVELGVHDSQFFVRTTVPKPPLVVVTDPETTIDLTLDPIQLDPADPLRWLVFYRDADTGRNAAVRPGMRIDITDGGRRTRVDVPELSATSDATTDVVSGRVPWPGEVTVQLAVEGWLAIDAAPIAPLTVTTDADGRFRLDLRGRVDLAPGWWGTVHVVRPEGHRFRAAFAEPFLRVPNEFGRALSVRADAGATVALAVFDAAGGLVTRSVGSEPATDGLQTPILPSDPEIPDARWPVAGQTVRLTIDGRAAVETVVRGALARYDPEVGTITGRTAAGAWIRTLYSEYRSATESTTTADDAGRFALRVAPRPFVYADSTPFLVRTGPASAESFVAATPVERVRLYGNVLDIEHDGSGPLEIVVEPSAGGPAIRRFFRPEWWESTSERLLFDALGRPVVLRPGDRLTSRPDDGTAVSFVVPSLTIERASGSALVGGAPPGARMDIQWTNRAPSVRQLLSPEAWWFDGSGFVHGYAAVGETGRFDVPCAPRCPPAQAIVRASVQHTTPGAGRPQPYVYFLAEPISGVSLHTAHVHGFATAGSTVRVALLDTADQPIEVREREATFPMAARLPGWSIDWGDRFPDGIPPGTRFGIAAAGDAMTLTVPAALPIVADVLTDRVRGGGPPGDGVDVWALPNRADVAGREPTRATATVGPDGRWTVAFTDFDLRAGDDLFINSVAGDGRTFFQLNVLTIDGPFEPTRTPTAEPTITPRATATRPAPTPRSSGRVWLPWAGRAATPRRGSELPRHDTASVGRSDESKRTGPVGDGQACPIDRSQVGRPA